MLKMKFKVQMRDAAQSGITCEEVASEPYKLKKPMLVQANADQKNFRRAVYLLVQDILNAALQGKQSETSQLAAK